MSCCYLYNNDLGKQCGRKAEWEIFSQKPGLASYDCITQSCMMHVGELLDDAEQHFVYEIKE